MLQDVVLMTFVIWESRVRDFRVLRGTTTVRKASKNSSVYFLCSFNSTPSGKLSLIVVSGFVVCFLQILYLISSQIVDGWNENLCAVTPEK